MVMVNHEFQLGSFKINSKRLDSPTGPGPFLGLVVFCVFFPDCIMGFITIFQHHLGKYSLLLLMEEILHQFFAWQFLPLFTRF